MSKLTDAEVKSALASLAAAEIAALRARLEEIFRGVDRDWPKAMCNGELPPSVSFLLFSAVEALEEHVSAADELARQAAEYDEEYARSLQQAPLSDPCPG